MLCLPELNIFNVLIIAFQHLKPYDHRVSCNLFQCTKHGQMVLSNALDNFKSIHFSKQAGIYDAVVNCACRLVCDSSNVTFIITIYPRHSKV